MNIATAKELNELFKLNPKISDNSKISAGRDTVLYLTRNALYQMAEHNYPYETQFGHNGQTLPADPVKKACSSLKSTDDPKDEGATDLKNLYAAISVYYDMGEICVDETGKACKYVRGTVQPTLAEAFEHCNGMGLYRCPMDGENDFFPADGNRYCQTTNDFPSKIDGKCNDWLQGVKDYKGGINPEWIQKHLGFDFGQAKNIIFTTGSLDPNAGGVYVPKDANADAANGVYSYNIERYVSGQDLLEPSTCDPNTLKNARFQIVKILKCWSGVLSGDSCRPEKLKTELPRLDETTPSKCELDIYPYGQKEGDSGSSGASVAYLSMLATFGSIILAA
ncbi:PCP-1.1 protein [Aphelenchoides avenae]|nr:PCP-1.1 protein [Aphelenchus avenae]